jgi:hypothetical protein
LILLNADAKALCLRSDPELVKVFGIPPRRRSVESCPSAAADGVSVAPRRPAAAPAGESRKNLPRSRHCADERPEELSSEGA